MTDSPFASQAPSLHNPPLRIGKDTFLIRSLFGGDAPLSVYVNSLVIAGPAPIVVDTGTVVNRERWMADVFSIVEPHDIEYVFLSHGDHDHVGNLLLLLLELAPQATVITTWFSLERLAGDLSIPLERVRWVNDGESFDAGGEATGLPTQADLDALLAVLDPANAPADAAA